MQRSVGRLRPLMARRCNWFPKMREKNSMAEIPSNPAIFRRIPPLRKVHTSEIFCRPGLSLPRNRGSAHLLTCRPAPALEDFFARTCRLFRALRHTGTIRPEKCGFVLFPWSLGPLVPCSLIPLGRRPLSDQRDTECGSDRDRRNTVESWTSAAIKGVTLSL